MSDSAQTGKASSWTIQMCTRDHASASGWRATVRQQTAERSGLVAVMLLMATFANQLRRARSISCSQHASIGSPVAGAGFL
jgi:hypothetical protein